MTFPLCGGCAHAPEVMRLHTVGAAGAAEDCHRCGFPTYLRLSEGEDEPEASAEEAVPCEHCPGLTPPDDRVPTKAGGFAHAACAMRLSNALQNQRAHLIGGRGLVALKGGRS